MTRTQSVRFLLQLERLEARDVPSFLPPVSHPVELSTLRSVVVTNLGDTPSRDVAVTRYQSDDVAVLLGDGTGALSNPQYFDTGAKPYGLRAGDLNLDGKPDLAVCNLEAKTVSVLLGNGDGTFQPKMDFPAGTGAFWIAIGDVNNDTKPDLAVANYSWFGTEIENTVSVLFGNGDGTFQPFVAYEVGQNPQRIEVGDLNGDGSIDITTSNNSVVSVLLNQGDGTFSPYQDYGVALGEHALADVNKDSRLDIVAEAADDDVAVLLGNGDGTFQAQTNYFGGGFTLGPTVTDVNRDRRLDIVVINYSAATVSVLLGNGNGTFGSPSSYAVGASGPQVLAPGDLNNDRLPEVVVTSGNKKDVRVLINDGVWAPPIPPPPGHEAGTIQAERDISVQADRRADAFQQSVDTPVKTAAPVSPKRSASIAKRASFVILEENLSSS